MPAKSLFEQALPLARAKDHVYDPAQMEINAGIYEEAGCPDLAVPLLEKTLAIPGIGTYYSPVLLWLDPTWNPIRSDPGFQTLLKKYASDKPHTQAGG